MIRTNFNYRFYKIQALNHLAKLNLKKPGTELAYSQRKQRFHICWGKRKPVNVNCLEVCTHATM